MHAHLRDDVLDLWAAQADHRRALVVNHALGVALVGSSVVFALDVSHATVAGWWWLASSIAFALAWRAERRAATRLARAVDNLANAITILAELRS
jgi:hypothetical protein